VPTEIPELQGNRSGPLPENPRPSESRGAPKRRFTLSPATEPIMAADLPFKTGRLIRRLVFVRGPNGREQEQIAYDFAGYFRDGLDAGRSVEELTEALGNPKRLRKQISRAHMRRRGLLWHLGLGFARVVAAAVYGPIVLFFALMIWLCFGSANPNRNFWQEYNAPVLAIPEANRAWPVYRTGLLALRGEGGELVKGELTPQRPDWPDIRILLEDNATALDLFRQAGRRPRLGHAHSPATDVELDTHMRRFDGKPPADIVESDPLTIADNPPILTLPLEHVRPLLTAGRLLCLDALYAIEQGDSDRAVTDISAALRVAHLLGHESRALTPQWAAQRWLAYTLLVVQDIAGDSPDALTTSQWIELTHRIQAVFEGGRLWLNFESERDAAEDVLQRVYTEAGYPVPDFLEAVSIAVDEDVFKPDESEKHSNSRIMSPVMMVIGVGRDHVRAEHNRFLTLNEAFAAQPLWLRTANHGDKLADELCGSIWRMLRNVPLPFLMVQLTDTIHDAERYTQLRAATITAIALELYRRDHGDWPATLDQLVPELLPAVPLDRFDGRPLKYTLIDGKPLLYSVGVDRDDDGGRLIAPKEDSDDTPYRRNRRASEWVPPAEIKAMRGTAEDKTYDGDWILWPRIKDEPSEESTPASSEKSSPTTAPTTAPAPAPASAPTTPP
jgi:hypothetical protein